MPGLFCTLAAALALSAPPDPPPAFPPDRAAQIMALVESYQPAEPYLQNKWSMVVRSAFLYAGAQKMFAAESAAIRACAIEPPLSPDEFVLAALGELPWPGQHPEIAAEARRFLETLEHNDLLIHLDELAGTRSRLLGPPPYWGLNAPLSAQETYEFGPLRNLSIGACARMALAADDHLGIRVVQRFSGAMELGRVACGRPMLMALFTGQSIQNRIMLEAMRLVVAGKLDAELLRALLNDADRHHLPSPRTFIDIERIIGLDAIDRFFDKKTEEDQASKANQLPTTNLTKPEAIELFNAAIDRALKLAGTRLFDIQQEGDPVAEDAALLTIPEGRTDPERLLSAVMPPMPQILLSEREHRCIRAALRAAILLELHKLANGAYPAAASEITPPPGETWPTDPLAPTKPLGYKRLTSAEPPYLLYSVGADGEDNSGKSAPQRNRNALVNQSRWAGSDFIISPSSKP